MSYNNCGCGNPEVPQSRFDVMLENTKFAVRCRLMKGR